MYIPDHTLVKKIKAYDPALYVVWNNQKEYFELWRKKELSGSVMVTPVTESLYEENGKIVFTPLDERLLMWLYYADSFRSGGHRQHAIQSDERWKEFIAKQDQRRRQNYKDWAKDLYTHASAFYTTKHVSKNSAAPKFDHHKPQNKWVRPDLQKRTSSRIFSRSVANAKLYNYRAKGG